MTLAWCLVPDLDTALQERGNIKAKPKRVFFPSTVYLFYSPKVSMDWWQPRDVITQEHESINNFRGCKYRIELNVSFLSLEDEEVIKWRKSLIFFLWH